jgi:putative glycosyltransferase
MKLSIVTSLYRSAPYIREFQRRSLEAIRASGASSYEIIFVNDGSPDDSLAIAKSIAEGDANVTVIDLSRNFGQHRAIFAGLEQSTGDFIFVIDSDLEEDPEWLPLFLSELQTRGGDVVYGYNTNIKRGYVYSLCRQIFYKTLNLLSSAEVPENVCNARVMSRRYVNALLQFREREIFMAGIWHMAGFEQHAVKVVKHDTSPTTYSFIKLGSMFINAITAFSTRPLVAISATGIGLSLVACSYVAFIVYRKLIHGIAVEGWASVMAAVLMIGGISLFFNGIMAIYIAKIFIEVKQRPLAIVREIYSQSDSTCSKERKAL